MIFTKVLQYYLFKTKTYTLGTGRKIVKRIKHSFEFERKKHQDGRLRS